MADCAVGAVATTNVFGLRLFGLPVMHNGGAYLICILNESGEAGTSFHAAPGVVQLTGQEALMIVLRICQRIRIGAKTFAHVFEAERKHLTAAAILTALPQMGLACRDALPDHLVGKTKLIIKFKRARLYYHGARMFARPFRLRDEPDWHSLTRQA